MAPETPDPKDTEKKEAREAAEAFLAERSRARAHQLAQMGFGNAARQPTSEDFLVQGILGRLFGGGTATGDERSYLRRKLDAIHQPTGIERIPLPLQDMSPLERLKLGAALDAIRHAAGE